MLRDAGFEQPSIEPTRIYDANEAAAFLAGTGLDPKEFAKQIEGKFMSAFVRGVKPAKALRAAPRVLAPTTCCEPGCCAEDH